MSIKEGLIKLKKVRDEFTVFVDKAMSLLCTDDVILEVMNLRGYRTQNIFDTLKEVGILKLDYVSELRLVDPTLTDQQLKDWGMMTDTGEYLLRGRYAIPVRDIRGKVSALIGWYPDFKKYVTTPTFGFSKNAMFFNMDHAYKKKQEGETVTYLVEGIFDTLSLRSLGFSALGQMGLEMSYVKTQILKRYSKIVAIPDNDKAGRSVNPYTNRVSGKGTKFTWEIENEHVFVSLPEGVKDTDDFIRDYLAYDDLLSCQSARFIKKLKVY